jgi:hypothetical protein
MGRDQQNKSARDREHTQGDGELLSWIKRTKTSNPDRFSTFALHRRFRVFRCEFVAAKRTNSRLRHDQLSTVWAWFSIAVRCCGLAIRGRPSPRRLLLDLELLAAVCGYAGQNCEQQQDERQWPGEHKHWKRQEYQYYPQHLTLPSSRYPRASLVSERNAARRRLIEALREDISSDGIKVSTSGNLSKNSIAAAVVRPCGFRITFSQV